MKPMLCNQIRRLFAEEHICRAAAIPFSLCHVTLPGKLDTGALAGKKIRTAILFVVPYYSGEVQGRTLSVYAAARDYHLYFRALFSAWIPVLEATFPGYTFSGYSDNAPIDERHAALIAGLGIRGDNGLFLDEEYGSYVFLGEILTDLPTDICRGAPWDEACAYTWEEVPGCMHCGACRDACPMYGNPFGVTECLSAVTQTKHLDTLCRGKQYTPSDCERLIRYYGTAWGCDRCQSSCPHNRAGKITPVRFFLESLMPHPTSAEVCNMDTASFEARAFAWRKKSTILRNLELLEADAASGLPPAALLERISDAVRQTGKIMAAVHGVESEPGSIDEKEGSANFVTIHDVRIQNILMEQLHAILPEARFFAEEKENDPLMLEEGYTFLIDPIDGTTNFIHGYGISAISVGLLFRGTPVFGVICDPYREELFEARRGLGAFCNGRSIHVSDRPLEKSVFAVGTAPYYKDTLGERTFAMMRGLFEKGADVRRLGSAALDLAAVACGRADGYAELRISPWDYAAGVLLVTEAGGTVTDCQGGPIQYGEPQSICAGTGVTHAAMLAVCGE